MTKRLYSIELDFNGFLTLHICMDQFMANLKITNMKKKRSECDEDKLFYRKLIRALSPLENCKTIPVTIGAIYI